MEAGGANSVLDHIVHTVDVRCCGHRALVKPLSARIRCDGWRKSNEQRAKIIDGHGRRVLLSVCCGAIRESGAKRVYRQLVLLREPARIKKRFQVEERAAFFQYRRA